MNRISVIIPTYQHAHSIVRCLESVLAQSRCADEIIIVDDGSIDDTQALLAPFQSKILYIFQENAGSQMARMLGFQRSHGDLVIFCDADVVMKKNMLAELEYALQMHPEASYAYPRFRWGLKLFTSGPFDAERLRDLNYIHTTALIRREDFPGFDPHVKRFQDWDLWLTMLESHHIGIFVDKILFRIIHKDHRVGISNWLPSFVYRLPWKKVGWIPKSIQKYQNAKHVVERKHGL